MSDCFYRSTRTLSEECANGLRPMARERYIHVSYEISSEAKAGLQAEAKQRRMSVLSA